MCEPRSAKPTVRPKGWVRRWARRLEKVKPMVKHLRTHPQKDWVTPKGSPKD